MRAGDGVLFEYAESQWRERGRGEMRVNVAVGAGAQARLVMRQRGNLRLLLNANLFPGMKLTPMDGGKVRQPLPREPPFLCSCSSARSRSGQCL